MNTFIVTVEHDNGTINIRVTATNKEFAKSKIMKVENCPESAIVKVVDLGDLLNVIRAPEIVGEIHKLRTSTEKVYLDYVNNYLTVKAFALDKGIDEADANMLINIGRILQNL